jgi:hypothetical protein
VLVFCNFSNSTTIGETEKWCFSNEIESQSLGASTLGGDELYNAVAFGDGEAHSRQRILSFAAKR